MNIHPVLPETAACKHQAVVWEVTTSKSEWKKKGGTWDLIYLLNQELKMGGGLSHIKQQWSDLVFDISSQFSHNLFRITEHG